MINNWQKNLVDTITPETIRKYFVKSGWVLDESFQNRKLFLFEKQIDNEKVEILIPNSDKFTDFKVRVFDAAQAISEINSIDLYLVLSEMAKPCIDIYEYHFKSDILKTGTMPLDVGSKIIQSIKDFILYSACAEELPRFKINKASSHSTNFIRNTRLAQTGIGSYIIRVEFSDDEPVVKSEIDIESCKIVEQVPFSRKVIKRMQKALSQITEIRNTQDINQFAHDAYETGINGNMCNAIMEMYEPFKELDEKLDLSTNVKFSFCDKQVEDIPERVEVDSMAFNFVNILADAYKKSEVRKNIELIGQLTNIAALQNKDIKCGQVKIKTNIDDAPRTVSAVLENEVFTKACHAMGESKLVKVTGDLDLSSKFWYLDNVSNFQVLE